METVDEDDFDDMDDELWALGDLQLYDSPLEKKDAVLYFKDVLSNLETNNKPVYERILQQLDEGKVAKLQELFKTAESQEEQAKKLEEDHS